MVLCGKKLDTFPFDQGHFIGIVLEALADAIGQEKEKKDRVWEGRN